MDRYRGLGSDHIINDVGNVSKLVAGRSKMKVGYMLIHTESWKCNSTFPLLSLEHWIDSAIYPKEVLTVLFDADNQGLVSG